MKTLINHLISITAGYFFFEFFLLTYGGVTRAFIFVGVTQFIDMIAFMREHDAGVHKLEVEFPDDPHISEWRNKTLEIWFKLIQLYIFKVLWYTGVLLVTAYVAS